MTAHAPSSMIPSSHDLKPGEALLEAVSLQNLSLLQAMIGQATPQQAELALSRAAGRGWMAAVDLILPHADVAGRRSHPMLAAVAQGRLAVMERLWTEVKGGNPDRDSGLWAEKALERGQTAALRWLVAHVPITAHWAPALARAAQFKQADMIDLLATPALVAATVSHLLEKDYNASVAVDQLTPYLTAAQMGRCMETLGTSRLPLMEDRRRARMRQTQLQRRPPSPIPSRRTRT